MGFEVAAIGRGADKAELSRKPGAHHYLDSSSVGPGQAGASRMHLATLLDQSRPNWQTGIDATGFSNDQICLKHNSTTPRPSFSSNAFKKKLCAQGTDGFPWLINDSQERRQNGQVFNVIVTNKANIFRDHEISFTQCLHGSYSSHVIDRENRRW
jgi:hypothetical protein